MFVFNHYNLRLRILKVKQVEYEDAKLLSTSLKWRFLLESFFTLIHTPPGVAVIIPNVQLGTLIEGFNLIGKAFDVSFNAYVCFFMLFRLHILRRIFFHYSQWNKHGVERICMLNGFEPSFAFAIKSTLKRDSIKVLTITLAMSIAVFGFAVRDLEK